MFQHVAKLGWEGTVSKSSQPYRSDRYDARLKIKTVMKGKFPVIGFVEDPTEGRRTLRRKKKAGLVYMGKVGTGWSRPVSSQIRKPLDTVVIPKSKLTNPKTQGGLDRTEFLRRKRVPGHHVGGVAPGKFV
jgi:bifunctional non-homologous end joining protein LigD